LYENPNIDMELEVLGTAIYDRIEELLAEKKLTKTTFAIQLGREPTSLNKLFYDLRLGSISLKNLYLVANSLEVEISELFKIPSKNKEELNMWNSRIVACAKTLAIGTEFELKELLSVYWDALTYPQRQKLGKDFYADVTTKIYPNIEFIRKGSDNHAIYAIV
jgi:transcriptional regulator with XRE-family HTH domain